VGQPDTRARRLDRGRRQSHPARLRPLPVGAGSVGAGDARIPRDCGRFLWARAQSALATRSGSVYVAMFDELDEGTALLPIAASAADVPAGMTSVTLDQDHCTLPKEWYLSLVARIADSLCRDATLGAMPQPGT
jgi:hypothetical protein